MTKAEETAGSFQKEFQMQLNQNWLYLFTCRRQVGSARVPLLQSQ